MPDYREMYITLFQSVTRAITILQEAQKQTEAMYLAEEAAILKPHVQPELEPKAPSEKG